jgi:hypothetical protein
MKFRISNAKLIDIQNVHQATFPKYVSQLINWANQNAQGTRPKVVGQMSTLFQDYLSETNDRSPESWRRWYLSRHPDAVQAATDKIYHQVENLQKAIMLIDRDMVEAWVDDLVISKTYHGMYVQEAILVELAHLIGETYRLATPKEEAQGIDGYVGETAYSIKPDSYRVMGRLSENIDVQLIYYTKTNDGLLVEVEG